jgi:hypothetical protein
VVASASVKAVAAQVEVFMICPFNVGWPFQPSCEDDFFLQRLLQRRQKRWNGV